MKYELLIRSRARRDETIEQKHARFVAGLRAIAPPWGLAGKATPPPPEPGEDLIADMLLSRYFGNGIRGEVVYQTGESFVTRLPRTTISF